MKHGTETWRTPQSWFAVAACCVVTTLSFAGCVEDDEEAPIAGSEEALSSTVVAGNPTCASLGLGRFEYKVEFEQGDGIKQIDPWNTISLVFESGSGLASFTSTLGIDAVLMKGGPNANVWVFDPESYGESGLATPVNPNNGTLYGISHVTFCFDYELTIEKTAETSFTRTFEWDIAKSVSPAEHVLAHDGVGISDYEVTLTRTGWVDSDFAAEGVIRISNFTPYAASVVDVTDVLSVGDLDSALAIECSPAAPATLASGEEMLCAWAAAFDGPDAGINSATVSTSADSLVGGASTSTAVSWDGARIDAVNEAVTVTDTFAGETTLLGSASGDASWIYGRAFACGQDEGSHVNVATIVETGQSADATVTVTCLPPPEQGCTPGYWKNHLAAWAPTGYSPTQLVSSVFASSGYAKSTDMLQTALDYQGGSTTVLAGQTLLRAATAALLDAAHPGVLYPIDAAKVIAMTNAALASGNRTTILATKDVLDAYNNLGCPL